MLLNAFNYKQWADNRSLAAIKRIDENIFKESVIFSLQQLNHMVIVEELFKSRLLGISPKHNSTNTVTIPDLVELKKRIEFSNDWYINYVSESQDFLNEVVKFKFVDGQGGSMSRREILFHIINHGTYHRGAIGHALDLCLVKHPADTYTVFIHETEPNRR